MSNRIYVTPVTGKSPRAPMPPYETLPAEGMWSTEAAAWRRLERFGDVAISAKAPVASQPAATKAAAVSKSSK